MEWIIYYVVVSVVISAVVFGLLSLRGLNSAKEPDFLEEFYEEEKNAD